MSDPRRVYMVCNAHIDPVWLWERDEGIAAALSTFRCAADFCEEFDGFVFNHNEALLYEWVEEYEPELFQRICRLVAAGSWHIMGGWYLQPDCNLPSGESLVRQILAGRRYFESKFGVRPRTATNLDSFGHDRGLVQILAGTGFDSYLICRPPSDCLSLPAEDFRWVGHDGSSVLVHRSTEWYNSPLGKARERLLRILDQRADNPLLVLWGVGDHGGGPSRQDLRDLAEMGGLGPEGSAIHHATPEAYFDELRRQGTRGAALQDFKNHLRPWGVGCYTSMVRVKQGMRALEDALYSTEKLLASAVMNGLLSWPTRELGEIQRDLMFTQFHDVVPGSAVPAVEAAALDQIGAGLDRVRRLRTQALFALASGLPPSREGEIPILVFNPHPWPVEAEISCEFQLQDQNWEESVTVPELWARGEVIPSQLEHEASNIALDWRKKLVFRARLEPSGCTRFDAVLHRQPYNWSPGSGTVPGSTGPSSTGLVFHFPEGLLEIDRATGLPSRYEYRGQSALEPGACSLGVFQDDPDPWGMTPRNYSQELEHFVLATPEEAACIAGVDREMLEPVRIIETGPVRTVVEVVFTCGRGHLVRRYLISRNRPGFGIEDELLWSGPDRMLKLLLPTGMKGADYLGQGACGPSLLPTDGSETVARRWVAAVSEDRTLLVFTDSTYGSDFRDGTLRLNYLRTAAYAAHPIPDRPLVPRDRASPRIDTGLRRFSFHVEAGPPSMLADSERRSLERGEGPFAVSLFPPGIGRPVLPGCRLEGNPVLLALKASEDGDGWIIRLQDPAGKGSSGKLSFPALGLGPFPVSCGPRELRSWRLGRDGLLRPVSHDELAMEKRANSDSPGYSCQDDV